jgi:hypothetical protein
MAEMEASMTPEMKESMLNSLKDKLEGPEMEMYLDSADLEALKGKMEGLDKADFSLFMETMKDMEGEIKTK